VHLERVTAGAAVLGPVGELDMANSAELAGALTTAMQHGRTEVVLDLDAVTFIDMSILGEMIRAREAARRAGVTFRIVHARGIVRRVLHLTGTYAALTTTTDNGGTGFAGP
jgi:anti-sigma B factor antagonist